MQITKQTARRFVLGRQGLWPGRRWSGVEGTAQALLACEALQLDPLVAVARSHDIALWGRVFDYRPEHLQQVAYADRQFFDYGGGLFTYPMRELPYWRLHMQRWEQSPRWAHYMAANAALVAEMMEVIRERGPVCNRSFTGRARVNSYRGRKDTGPALFNLWLHGDLMIAYRQGFERYYDLRERVAPPELDYAAGEQAAGAFFERKAVAFHGLVRDLAWRHAVGSYLHRTLGPEEGRSRLDELAAQQVAAPVEIEGSREHYYVLSEDLPRLQTLEQDQVPADWRPLGPTTDTEAVFLAPLDIVSARGRARWLFDFEYVWEVYKPAHQRRWGYYTIPILYGDRLVARLDPKLDRASATLEVRGLWLEEWQPEGDAAFGDALGRGLARFAQFLDARTCSVKAVLPAPLRDPVIAQLAAAGIDAT